MGGLYSRLFTPQPLASEIPSVETLVQQHGEYMQRLPEDERHQSDMLTSRLNVSALLSIAGRALGSECYGLDKIYQGKIFRRSVMWYKD
jgi:hypothetical protein